MGVKERTEKHAKLRLLQRYGVRISAEKLRQAVERIRCGEGILLKRFSKSDGLFAVELGRDATLVPVVYSRARKTILTVLPEHVLARHASQINHKRNQSRAKRRVEMLGAAVRALQDATVGTVPPTVGTPPLTVNTPSVTIGAPSVTMVSPSVTIGAPPVLVHTSSQHEVQVDHPNTRVEYNPWHPARVDQLEECVDHQNAQVDQQETRVEDDPCDRDVSTITIPLPVQSDDDKLNARFKFVDPTFAFKFNTYIHFKQTGAGRLILYVQRKEHIAASQAEAFAMLRRELELRLVQYPERQRSTIVDGFLDRFSAGLEAVGLQWELETPALAA